MIYDYYCVDCGNKIEGGKISFDLAEMIGLRTSDSGGAFGKYAQVTDGQLRGVAGACKQTLVHDKKIKIEITLRSFLQIMGWNLGKAELREQMADFEYSELSDALSYFINTNENEEAAGQLINDYQRALKNKFIFRPARKAGEPVAEEERQNLQNYKASFWIKPEFLENGRSDQLYTVQYSQTDDTPNMETLKAPTEIRGYCPHCGKPVLKGTGKYPHILIGLLGVQSSGKTSTIVAMMSEILSYYDRLGVKFPGNILCDSRYQAMQDNIRLFSQGWAVRKTDVETSAGTFNASLLLESTTTGVKKVLTFVDIAGEQCFNTVTETINRTAFKVYPLINSCDIYLLCSCINQNGYGNADGDQAFIPPQAVLLVARGIYESLRDPGKVPPLGVILTKADMAANASTNAAPDNPFASIRTGRGYLYQDAINALKNTYNMIGSEDIREPLRWSCRAYDDLKDVTYMMMMSCSALGRDAVKYEGAMDNIPPYTDENGRRIPFHPIRLLDFWEWILKNAGLVPVSEGKYAFRTVPNYAEKYILQNTSDEVRKKNLLAYKSNEALMRCINIGKVFMNPSASDKQIVAASREEIKGRFGLPLTEEKRAAKQLENIETAIRNNRCAYGTED